MAPRFGPQATLPTCFLPVCSAAPGQWGDGICTRLVSAGVVSSSPQSMAGDIFIPLVSGGGIFI